MNVKKEGSGSGKQGSQGRGDLWVRSQGDIKKGKGEERNRSWGGHMETELNAESERMGEMK